jgi:multidrug resistance efflux pump
LATDTAPTNTAPANTSSTNGAPANTTPRSTAPGNTAAGEYEEDFTPKTAKRKIDKRMITVVASVIVLVALMIGAYFIYEGTFYYQTNNAKVDAKIFQLTANASGKLIQMDAHQGEQVKAGQVLARVRRGPDITSPVDGTVIEVRMNVGDYPDESDVVAVVAETSDVYITANVEETNILEIKPGQSVSVSLDAYGRSFDGYVADVNPMTSTSLNGAATSFTTSGTYTKVTQLIPIKIKLVDNVDLTRIIGTNATVKIRIR